MAVELGKYLRPAFYGGIAVIVTIGLLAFIRWMVGA